MDLSLNVRPIDPIDKTFQALYALQCEGNNCDINLISEDDEKFCAHACVLAASIPIFSDLIKSCRKPDYHPFKVRYVKGRELDLVIQYAYLKHCDLEECAEAALALLEVATSLEIDGLQSKCSEVLVRHLDIKYAVIIYEKDSSNPHWRLVREMSELFLLRHLTTDTSGEVHSLSGGRLLALLQDHRLYAPFEEMALDTVRRWVEHDPFKRSHMVPQLLLALRLGTLAPRSLEETRKHSLVAGDACALAVLERAHLSLHTYLLLAAAAPSVERQSLPALLQPRLPHAVVLVMGGWQGGGGPSRTTFAYDCIAETWSQVPWLNLRRTRLYFGVQQLGELLYLVGGHAMDENSHVCTTLDLRNGLCQDISSMHQPRCFVSTAMLDGEIYAVGGRNSEGRLTSVEKYTPATNTWTMMPSTSWKHSDSAAVVLNGKIYVAGGFDGNAILNKVEVFDPAKNEWRDGISLNIARSGLCCETHGGSIYALGGFNSIQGRLTSCERFDPVTSTWTMIAPMQTTRSNFASTVLDNRIFVFGGFAIDGTINHCEVYDIVENCWYPVTSMPWPKSATSCICVNNLEFAQRVWGCIPRDDPGLLRDPEAGRPRYHPLLPDATLVVAPSGSGASLPPSPGRLDESDERLEDFWSETSSISSSLEDSDADF